MNEIAPQAIQQIAVDKLLLDSENPRLPERLRGKRQSEILEFLYEQGALEELAQSYVDNGFFKNEPLIVVQENGENVYTVVEGNRRLAALLVLRGSREADELRFDAIYPTEEQIEELSEVPCFLISGRNEVRTYIGFRHIGGIKTWPPEAKARYLLGEVKRLAAADVANPFPELARRVGSNVQGIRNSYLAFRILLYAREEFGLNVGFVQEQRFGVWLRCMNSADIRRYIGLGQARTYREIEKLLEGIEQSRLAEVLGDLESRGRHRAVLGDSRDVTMYGRALMDKRARAALRSTGDLSLARQIVDELDLTPRAWRLVDSVRLFLEALQSAETTEASNDLLLATEELSKLVRSARAIVKDRMDDRDSEP